MKAAGWLAIVVLVALAVRQFFPREVVELVPGPPEKPDTVYVERLDMDTLYVDRVRTVVTTDTLSLAYDVTVAPEAVAEPEEADQPPLWYVRRLVAGQKPGDTTFVALRRIWADSALLGVQDAGQRLYTPGPLRSIESTPRGIRVDFGEWPEPEKGCDFWCRLGWAAAGGAAITLAREAL